MTDKPEDARALQMLITGMLMGAVTMREDVVSITVEPAVDDQGNWQPWFYVTGDNSGTRLKVTVTIE